MTTIAYSSPFVPPEWIAAHGLRPKRIVPHAAAASAAVEVLPGVCPYARAFVSDVLSDTEAVAVVATTTCDQMRRAPDLVELYRDMPVFLMNVPATWQTASAQRLYRDELERLGRFLERLGAKAPANEELAQVMLDYDALRAGLRSARDRLTARQWAEELARLGGNGNVQLDDGGRLNGSNGVRLAIVGGPLLQDDFEIYELVEVAGGRIVLDATETGERALPAPFDRRRVRDDPLGELADAYFGAIPDAFRRPNSRLYEWLEAALAEHAVAGIIFHHYVWCDMWGAEAYRLKEWSNVPVLALSTGDSAADQRTRIAGQVAAFMEMLA